MTVVVQTPFNEHVGNGVTTVFGFTFQLLAAVDLVVSVNGVEQPTSAYTISGLGVQAGGDVTFNTAPANGAEILLSREIELSRSTDYQQNGDLRSDTVDEDFDRIWQALQGQQALLGGVLRVQYPTQITALPEPEAATLIGWNSDASALQNYELEDMGVSVSYAQWRTQEFSGDDVETEFVLDHDAGVASNIDLTVGGVSQSSLTDFTYAASTRTITFNAAPETGTNNIVARYGQALPQTVPDIDDNELSLVKLEQIGANTLLGRGSGAGNVEEIVLGTNLSITAGVLNAAGGGSSPDKATSADVIAGVDDDKYLTAAALRGGSIVQATAQATTSGTSKDVTGIPPWAKRITIHLNGVSTNGTSIIMVQIGDGAIVTSGYTGSVIRTTGGGTPAGTAYASGFYVTQATIAATIHAAVMTLTKMEGSNTWFCQSIMGGETGALIDTSAGRKALTNALDRVRLTMLNGTDAFDAGSWSVSWE